MGYFSPCDFVCLTPDSDTWRSHLVCDVQHLILAVTFPTGLVDIREMVLIVSCQIYLLSMDCDCALTSDVGGSVFGLMGLPPLYFWQRIILVIVWISILFEITLSLAGSDVFFLPQTCLTRFQNLISVSCCNHVFEDGTVPSSYRRQTYLTDILIELQISGLPEWKSESLNLWLHLTWILFYVSFKVCSATIWSLIIPHIENYRSEPVKSRSNSDSFLKNLINLQRSNCKTDSAVTTAKALGFRW